MRKYVLILIALVFTTCIAGCGTKITSGTSVSGITTVKILPDDILGKNLIMKSSKNNFQLNSIVSATDTGTLTGTTTDPRTGTWQFLEPAGTIVVTDDTTGTHTFTCIQKETEYLLVYDDTEEHKISRLYLDPTTADSFDPTLMGGSKQGKDLTMSIPSAITVSTLAGSPAGKTIVSSIGNTNDTTGHANLNGASASFSKPMDITTDGNNFYVADYNNNQIRMIDKAGNVTLFAGSPTGASGSADGVGNAASFYYPIGITTDGTNLYVTDSGNQTIRQIVISSAAGGVVGTVTTIAGFNGIAGSTDSLPIGTGPGKTAAFSTPIGITTDGTNLYVADSGNQTIRKVRILSPNTVTTIAGNVGSIGSTDGISTSARFNKPTQITTDGSNLYVTDYNSSTIRKIVISTGAVTTLAGIPNVLRSTDTTSTTKATFFYLCGITTDGINLYVTDYSISLISNIRKVVIADGTVTTLAGGNVSTALTSSVSKDGLGNEAFFLTPAGITTDGVGLYLTDSTDNNIRRLRK